MSRKKRNDVEEIEGAPEWMVTYSDLVTLLLTFFIMLFSMATIDKQKFEEVAQSLRSSFLRTSNGEMFQKNQGKEIFAITEQNNVTQTEDSESNNEAGSPSAEQQEEQQAEQQKLDNIKEQVQKAIIGLNLGEHVKIIDEKAEIILRFDSVLLFDLGSAEVKPSGREVLQKIGLILKQLDNEIMVQGHTDDLPIETFLYPTNWELSTKRATNVVVFLVNNASMNPKMLTATGNGEFKPIAPNDSEANRQKNRRIDIVIVKK